MLRPRGTFAFAMLAVCVIAVALVPACVAKIDANEQAVNESIANLDIVVCGTMPTIMRADGIPETRREWYNLNAWNATLKSFPAFAAAAGVASVTDCISARHVAATYEVYSNDFPDFDQDQPVEESTRPPGPEPEPDPSAHDVWKLVGSATLSGVRPVVAIDTRHYAGGGACTGTFIARNWIVTAAHCMLARDPATPNAMPFNDPKSFFIEDSSTLQLGGAWVGGSKDKDKVVAPNLPGYKITFFGLDGQPLGDPLFYPALQYINPQYKGFFGGSRFNDFALLYIPQDQDNRLHADPMPPNFLQEPWMRISRFGVPTTSAVMYGAGNFNGVSTALKRGTLDGYAYSVSSTGLTSQPLPAGAPFTCDGDSGGPIVDMYPVQNDSNNSMQPVLVAVHSSALRGPTCQGLECNCPGSVSIETRADTQESFINTTMKKWYHSAFGCRGVGVGIFNNPQGYMECWAKGCASQADCNPTSRCVHSAADLTGCIGQCGPGSSCSCFAGGCLPIAK